MPVSRKSKSRKGGRKGWATTEQFNWLQDRVPKYLELKANRVRRMNMFWIQLYDGWFERWPEQHMDNIDDQKLVRTVFSFYQGQS